MSKPIDGTVEVSINLHQNGEKLTASTIVMSRNTEIGAPG